ncbi:MAG: hypothetical protein ACRDLS_01715 [Solirubrobacteraceae bacterium]
MLAILASYQVNLGAGPMLAARGTEEWTSTSRLLITQPGFPEGRTTLPNTQGLTPTSPQQQQQRGNGGIEYADPSRFSALAALYAVISYSDQVRNRVPEKTKPGQIQAVPLDLNGSGQAFLPIVEITTKAETEDAARTLNVHTIDALRGLLVEQQSQAKIPDTSRVRAETLNAPDRAVLTSGRSHAASILALMLSFIASLALAHILEAIRLRRRDVAPAGPIGTTGQRATAEQLEAAYASRVHDWAPESDRLRQPQENPVSSAPPHGR